MFPADLEIALSNKWKSPDFSCDDAATMTLVVQRWFFVPFGKRGRVLNALPVNQPQCPFIQMTDTDVTFLSCYNTVGHTRCYARHDPNLPSNPAALQTLGRVEYATICRRTS